MITIKSIAQELNISTATVSRALSDNYQIGNTTKLKVLALAKQLNYEPNPIASNLRKQKSETIAVIIPEVANHFFSNAINGIEDIARQHGYHVLIYQTHDNSQNEINFIRGLVCGRVDGILISVSSNTTDNQHYLEVSEKIPTVFFDRVYDDIDAVKITTNDYSSAYKATCHLIECGCKDIAFLPGLYNLSTGKQRLSGYLDALKEHMMPYQKRLIYDCSIDDKVPGSQIKNFLQKQKPDGLLSAIEEFVIPCYTACNDLKLKIPEDIKIISFSNLDIAPLLCPPLSTITQPAFEIGKEAAQILFKILNKKWFESPKLSILDSTLIVRESTGKPTS